MLTIKGGSSFAPDLRAWVDSGRLRRRAGGCLKVVVTSRKITSTIRTSIYAKMMTAGAVCFLRIKKRMLISRRLGLFIVAILAAKELVAQGFHLDGKDLDLLVEVAPGHEGWNRNQEANQGRAQDQADPLGQFRRVARIIQTC